MERGDVLGRPLPEVVSGATRSLRRHTEGPVVALGGLLLASVPAASDGGFFSSTWAGLALVSLVVAALHLIVSGGPGLRAIDGVLLAAAAAVTAWSGLTAVWTVDLTATVDETLRVGAYTSVVLVLLVVVRPRATTALLAGVLGGIVAIATYSLLSRLRPDWVGTWDPGIAHRLDGPIGYWNGLGLYAAMGTLLAVGLAARGGPVVLRALAGAAPVILVPTILLTLSRGAWLALVIGGAVMIAVGPRRLQLVVTGLVLAVCPAVAVAVASTSDLTSEDITIPRAIEEGAALLRWILPLLVVAAAAGAGLALLSRRVRVPDRVARAAGIAAAGAAVAGVVVAVSVVGAPWTLVDRALTDVRAKADAVSGDEAERLFDLSSNGRLDEWRVAVDQFLDHPLGGEGLGTWEIAWNRDRPTPSAVKDAHSLYLEMLGEGGAVGLVLLVAMLAVPLIAIRRARGAPMAVPAVGAYSAFVCHAAVDWDWELAGVTVVALAAGAVLVVLARPPGEAMPVRLVRLAAPVVVALGAVAALAAVLWTAPQTQAREAYARLDVERAAREAERATERAPWSADAYLLLGRARLGLGELDGARAALTTAIEKGPADWEPYRDLAAVSAPDEAVRLLDAAIRLNPREPELARLRERAVALADRSR